jgi:serine/threonine-protein kinase
VNADARPSAGQLQPGATLAGYQLEDRIGRGGMAVVFRARDERLGRPVALKILSPGFTADHGFRTRFINESRAAAGVEHPHIIPVYAAGEADGFLYIAMRFVPGGDVRSELRRKGPFTAARSWRIISQIAAGLDAAHQNGLVHRDVKPANMLLDSGAVIAPRGPEPPGAAPPDHVYLTDFGISKQASAHGLTVTGQIIGTLDYAAPEQIEGGTVDGRTDQYSLACSAFELLTGLTPFRRDQGPALIYAHLSQPPPAVTASRSDLSTAVDQVIAKGMAKQAADRYPTCARFAADLGRALRLVPGPIEAVGQGLMPPVTSIRRRPDPDHGPRPDDRPRGGGSPRPDDRPRGGGSGAPAEGPRPAGGARPPAPSMPPGGLARPAGNEPPTRKREP